MRGERVYTQYVKNKTKQKNNQKKEGYEEISSLRRARIC